MKARTKMANGEIFFAYEDYYGNRFGTWHDIAQKGEGSSYLVGYFQSYYAGCIEPIDEMFLTGRPSIGIIKKFINDCKKFMEEN